MTYSFWISKKQEFPCACRNQIRNAHGADEVVYAGPRSRSCCSLLVQVTSSAGRSEGGSGLALEADLRFFREVPDLPS